jgi:hypothetical protein
MCFKPPACRPIRLRVALSAAFQCGFHVVISFATTLSFPHAHSFAMPATLSAAMERLMRFHSLCWLPSRRQCSAGYTVRLLAAPIALLAAIRCFFHNAILFAMPLSAAVQRLLPYAILLAMLVALLAALEFLMRLHSLLSRRKSCAGLRVFVFRAARSISCRATMPGSVAEPSSYACAAAVLSFQPPA